MKVQITNYTFNKSSKTVTFTDYTTIRLDSILLITNVTDNIIVYNFADPLLGGTVTNNVLTLTYDTSAMDDTDKLQIFYDDGDVQPANSELQTTLNSLTETLQELTGRLTVLASMANSGQPALRTIPIASVSTPVTGTVTATVANATISSLATIGSGGIGTNAINNTLVELANINNATAT
jgi:hypothetical protein